MTYEKIKYPDGQISVKITNFKKGTEMLCLRINSYEDLFLMLSIADALKSVEKPTSSVILNIPCLFGQRSDRRFSENQSFDLKLIADVINKCGWKSVSILDPHSDVSLALIKNSFKQSSYPYVQKSVYSIGSEDLVLISPDAGAYKKVFEYGEKLNLPVNAAVKHRDLEGNISLKFIGDVKDKKCLIVDDLADGGYTFYLLGKQLKELGAKSVYLYVTHGYFSKGFDILKEYIDGVYCTNSVKDISNEYFDGYNMKSLNGYVTQFNIM